MARGVDEALALFLKRLTMRSALGEAEQRAILALPADAVAVPVAQDFVRVGERLDHACLIVDGLAARFQALASGQRSIVALHIPGDMADLHSVVSRTVSWALQAVTPIHLNRVLRRLAANGTVAKAHSEVIIDDVGRLAAIGEFDPLYLQLPGTLIESDWVPIRSDP